LTKVIVAGHSFGAATVHRTAQIDKRVTGGVVLFDPWFLPFKEETLPLKLHVPVLSVNSETFRLRKENETP
jgi:pimeloyl-ACP methyl ester carboxylesterase